MKPAKAGEDQAGNLVVAGLTLQMETARAEEMKGDKVVIVIERAIEVIGMGQVGSLGMTEIRTEEETVMVAMSRVDLQEKHP